MKGIKSRELGWRPEMIDSDWDNSFLCEFKVVEQEVEGQSK